MSEIAELKLLIEKEKERGDDLDKQMMGEHRLLEAAEEEKHKIITKMLPVQLAELKEKNALKEKELIEIQKWKVSTLEEVSQMENKFGASVSFSFLYYIFWYILVIFTDRYVIYIYIYIYNIYIYIMLILCHVLFFILW